MDKKILSVSILTFSVLISAAIIGFAAAQAQQDPFDSIQYPVKELGNCQSKQACGTYCDKPANIDSCLAFAEKNNLMSQEEISQAKKFKEIGMVGPGGCTGKDSCDKYCNISDNIEECIAFAQKNGLMSGKELEESQKVLAAIKKGVKPPPCGGKDKCDAYCSLPENTEACMTFALEAGLMPPEEQANAQKMIAAIKQGIKPPACRGENECRNYCSQDEHIEECIKFGEATGMMEKGDAEMMRKTKGKGPGGCKSKQECDAFCNDPSTQEVCINFAKENGLISQEDSQKMEQGKRQMKEAFNNMPQEVSQCLNSALGSDMVEKLKNGNVMPPQSVGEKMRVCFESSMPKRPEGEMQPNENQQPGQEQQRNFGPQIQGGPGGCKSSEECQSFQSQNYTQPGSPEGQMGPQGPQGQFAPGTAPNMGPGTAPPGTAPGERMIPSEGMMQQRQGLPPELMPAGSAPGVGPGPAPQSAPGTAPGIMPQGEQAPPPATLKNSDNLFGFILKPFVRTFGL